MSQRTSARAMDHKRGLGVCMVIACFAPIVGGTEIQAQQLSTRLIAHGIDVCVLTRRYAGLASYEEIAGIPVYRVPAFGPRAIAAVVYVFSALLWLFFHRHRYQVIHAHQPLSPAIVGVLSKMLWGKKLVVKIPGVGHEGGIAQIKAMPLSSLRKKLLRQVDRFIYLSDDSHRELVDLGFADVAVKLPNGVDTDRFSPVSEEAKAVLRARLGLPSAHRLVIFTGRLTAAKRLDILLQSWADIVLSRGESSCHLLVLGEGGERAALQALAGQLGIETSLSFLGQKENVVDYVQAADIFVLPSETEGVSNALLEAMACGLAVVATDVGGSGEVLGRQQPCGLLIEPGDQEQLTRALLQVLRDRTLAEQLGREARSVVETAYSLDHIAGQYVALYESLLSGM